MSWPRKCRRGFRRRPDRRRAPATPTRSVFERFPDIHSLQVAAVDYAVAQVRRRPPRRDSEATGRRGSAPRWRAQPAAARRWLPLWRSLVVNQGDSPELQAARRTAARERHRRAAWRRCTSRNCRRFAERRAPPVADRAGGPDRCRKLGPHAGIFRSVVEEAAPPGGRRSIACCRRHRRALTATAARLEWRPQSGPALSPSEERVDRRRLRSARTRQADHRGLPGPGARKSADPDRSRRIAERAGCSVRSIFERFPDLHALRVAATDHAFVQAAAQVLAARAQRRSRQTASRSTSRARPGFASSGCRCGARSSPTRAIGGA